MFLDKTLILKGVAGVAGSGTVVGGSVGVSEFLRPKRIKMLNRANEIMEGLGVGKCSFSQEEIGESKILSKECAFTKEELAKVKFSNKGDEDIAVEGWGSDEGTISLKVNVVPERDWDIEYTFKDAPHNLTLIGKDKAKITIRRGVETQFHDLGGALNKAVDSRTANDLREKNELLKSLGLPEGCRFDESEVEDHILCELATVEDLANIRFSNKSYEKLTVVGWEEDSRPKLRVERDDYTTLLSFYFDNIKNQLNVFGDSASSKITISSHRKFKVEEGKLAKDPVDLTVGIRGNNHLLGNLNVPLGCRFDEREDEEKVSCYVTPEELKKMGFWNRPVAGNLIIEEKGFKGVTLEVWAERRKMRFIFKNSSKTIRLKGVGEYFYLRRAEDEFEIRNNRLGQVRKGFEEFKKLGIDCRYEGEGNTGKCTSPEGKVSVYVDDSNKGDVTVPKDKDIFSFREYVDGYNRGVVFQYKDMTTDAPRGKPKLSLGIGDTYQLEYRGYERYLVPKAGTRVQED